MTETKSAKRLPPWMSVKGAPERPNFDKFHQEKNALIAQRKAFIEEIKSLQAKMKEDKENDGIEKLRQQYKEQLDEIEKLMAVEKENKSKVTETIADVRQERQDLDKKARQYQKQVGCFSTVEEVDACITYLMEKMETSGKSATQMQKETDSKVKELRHVRHILSQNHSDDEQMQQIKMREDHLRGQLFEIQERIKKLAADRDYLLKERQEKTGVSKEKAKARSDMFQSITQLREKVNEVNTQLDKVFEEHKARVATWDAWCVEAKAKYELDQEERRAEQEREREAARLEEKKQRALERKNPYTSEVAVCDTLIQYLNDRKRMIERENAEREKREAAAHFDPQNVVPEGYVVVNEDSWKKSVPSKPTKSKAAKEGAPAKKKFLQHSEEKMKKFMLVNVEPPLSLEAVETTIAQLKQKKAELETLAKKEELQLSSDNDDADEEDKDDDKESGSQTSSDHQPQEKEDAAEEDGETLETPQEG